MEETAATARLSVGLRDHTIDDQTIEACQGGDSDAFRLLFEAYKDRVYSIALCFDGDEDSAKDITQHVFLKLMSNISQFANRSEFSTWLYRLVVNACLDKKRALRRFVFFGSSDEIEVRDPKRSAEDTHIRHELEASVRAAVATLKPKLKIAILLKYFEDLSYDEMAVALGCSRGTVASRLNRGHRILAKRLAHLRGAFGAEEWS